MCFINRFPIHKISYWLMLWPELEVQHGAKLNPRVGK